MQNKPALALLAALALVAGIFLFFTLPGENLRANFYNTPETNITSRPPKLHNSSKVTYSFRSDQRRATFQCRWFNNPWDRCSSPLSRSRLKDGTYSFEVRAVNNGRVDPTPALDSFRVDRTAPQTAITGAVRFEAVGAKAQVSLDISANEEVKSWECSLNRQSWRRCNSPWLQALSPGKYSLRARATDLAGNTDPSPAAHNFSVIASASTPAPNTIISGPNKTKDRTPTFTLSSNQGGVTFECSLNGASWKTCKSSYTTPRLGAGTYSLRARAKNSVGKVDASPASKKFTITK